jgi:23S rRNA (guanosine2251-2'-O)-methyltransferase
MILPQPENTAMSKKEKNRTSGESVWIYGKHAVKAALQNPERKISRFIVLESCRDYWEECNLSQIKTEIVDKNFFNALFGKEAIHQGCAVLAKQLSEHSVEELIKDESDMRPFIFLDRVSDPQNIGSILRAAAVFGARATIITEDNSPTLTSTAIKAASGAAELVPLIRVKNLVRTINNLKENGFWCIGLDERSDKKIYEISLKENLIVVIGSEGDGMRRLTRETCDFLVKLPAFANFATLNAAQAATFSLYEILRQKINQKL